jgi:hypothetical protein
MSCLSEFVIWKHIVKAFVMQKIRYQYLLACNIINAPILIISNLQIRQDEKKTISKVSLTF